MLLSLSVGKRGSLMQSRSANHGHPENANAIGLYEFIVNSDPESAEFLSGFNEAADGLRRYLKHRLSADRLSVLIDLAAVTPRMRRAAGALENRQRELLARAERLVADANAMEEAQLRTLANRGRQLARDVLECRLLESETVESAIWDDVGSHIEQGGGG